MKMRSLTVPVLVAIGSLTVAACGSDHDTHSSSAESTAVGDTAATIAESADFNQADVTFAQGMIPHHEQAVEMADLALDPNAGASAEVQELATAIQGGQDPEIVLMTGWLDAWDQPEMSELEGHDMSSMDGMMSADDMDELGTLKGAEFDAAWLTMMIAHHEGAVKMADEVKANGENADVATLADQIIAAQTAEIATMKALQNS